MEFFLHLLCVDLKSASLVYLEYASQKIIPKLTFSPTAKPLLLCRDKNGRIYFLVSDPAGSELYIGTHQLAFTKTAVALPELTQAALSDDGKSLYCIDEKNTLLFVDLDSSVVTPVARPENASCVGIALSEDSIHTAWETPRGGSIASFDLSRKLHHEYFLPAIPTNIACRKEKIYVTFTQSPLYGEGVAVFSPDKKDMFCSFYQPQKNPAFQLYPCNLIFSPQDDLLYILNEDAASVTCLRDNLQIHDYFSLGHSISSLQMTDDARFAICGSNMFADLLLLDLVNRKILSVSGSDAEFSSLLLLME